MTAEPGPERIRDGHPASGRAWSDLNGPYSPVLAAALAALAFGTILYLSRRFDFFFDEWDFVFSAQHWSLRDYFQPHNGHWSTVPLVIYKLLLDVNGMRSYLPFMSVLLLLRCAAALLLFAIVRRRSGDVLALAAMTVLLFLGAGWQDILWAFQIGFVGSMTLGLLAIYLLDTESAGPGRQAAASVSLLLSVMSSGVGLLFCVAVGADLVLDPLRRHRLWVLCLPIAAYAAWYLAVGRVATHVSSLAGSLDSLIAFVPFGIGAAVAGLVALPLSWSQAGTAALTALAAVVAAGWWRSGRLDSRVVAASLALVAQYVLTGLVRSQYGAAEAAAPRYVDVAAIFLLLGVTGVARQLPWRSSWPLLGLVALTVGFNAAHLRQAAYRQNRVFETQRAELATLWLVRDAPSLDRAAVVDPVIMPQVQVGPYLAARRAYGTTVPYVSNAGLGNLPPAAVNQALADVLPLRTTTVAGAAVATRPCTLIEGAPGYADVTGTGGGLFVVRAPQPGSVSLDLWLVGSAPGTAGKSFQLTGNEYLLVRLPDDGARLRWRLRIQLDTAGSALACPGQG
jgi:hypothetical protein